MKDKILRLIELKYRILDLETTDEEKKRLINEGSYALREGYQTDNMRQIEELEDKIANISLE